MIYDATMLNIGREKQLFIDDLVVESVENVCRTWHEPVKRPEGPVITKDQPWEAMVYFTFNGSQVIRDPKDGLFKCIYIDWKLTPPGPGDSAMGKSAFNLFYADSEDGVKWRKPLLDLHKVNGAKTNIIIPNAYNMGFALDPYEEDESRRFKAIYLAYGEGEGADAGGARAATSPDLIHWTTSPELPVLGRSGSRMDDETPLHFDPLGRIFILNMRHYDMYAIARNLNNPTLGTFTLPYYPLDWRRVNKRRIFQTESSDLIHWAEPYLILSAEDGLDDIDETFYGLAQFPYAGLKMGFLNCYHYVANTERVRLVYSRDGKRWFHLNKRQPILNPSGEGEWDAFMVTVSNAPIEVGDELFIFFGGSCNHHDWYLSSREGLDHPEATQKAKLDYSLGLAKLRLDGFCSLDAGPARRGIFITRPLISDGTKLVVNARCHPGGSIAAEVVNVKDEVFPGYSRQDCDVFTGDSTKHIFSWKGKEELPAAAKDRADYPKAEISRFRKIRFYMEKCELYALTLA